MKMKDLKGIPNPETCSKCKKEVIFYIIKTYFKKWCKIVCFECTNKKNNRFKVKLKSVITSEN